MLTSPENLQSIVFIGDTLGPLFLMDPKDKAVQDLYSSFASLDVEAAAEEWPFVPQEKAFEILSQMKKSLEHGLEEDLIWDYRKLFIGPPALPCPPWGSVYTDKDCVVFGASLFELRSWLRARDVEYSNKDQDPEDHIGIMLGLMSWIANNRPDDLEEYLCSHLFTWSSHYLKQLEQASSHPFFDGLARLTNLSLEGIEAVCSRDVILPKYYR